jgi:hypothetical protein
VAADAERQDRSPRAGDCNPREAAALTASTAPQSPWEEKVGKVWADILGRPRVARHENFFDIGGHSLLAAQVVARLNGSAPGALSVRALFEQPTLAAFAREVERRLGSADAHAPAHRVKRRTARPDLELVPPS